MIKYSSNNSGGSWWLKDKDWIALESAGWRVIWGGWWFCNSRYRFTKGDPQVKPATPCPEDKCQGHRMFETAEAIGSDASKRHLGALASYAERDGLSLADAIREFEAVTGQCASEDGCNCCGPPHSFSTDGQYVSGEEIADILNPSDYAGLSRRELLERLTSK